MRPIYSRERRLRQDIIRMLADALLDWSHGDPLPAAEVCDNVDARITTEINEAVQDALREIRTD